MSYTTEAPIPSKLTARGAGLSAAPPLDSPLDPEVVGPHPWGDGWDLVYRLYDVCIRPFPFARAVVRRYFWPGRLERACDGLLFRLLGVPRFGRLVPTGGVAVRRATGARMRPYTLAGRSLGAARAFFYRACIFEALHLAPMALLLGLSVRQLTEGRPDLAAQDLLVNLAVNVYPILHHRHTRLRILRLTRLAATRQGSGVRPRPDPLRASTPGAIP